MKLAKTGKLLALANKRYDYAQRAYKLAVEKSMSSPRESSLATPPPSNLQDDLTRTKKLLANSQEENADFLNQLKGS